MVSAASIVEAKTSKEQNHVMRQRLLALGKADVPTDEFIGEGWFVLLDEAVQRRGGFVPRLHLNGHHFPILLEQELDLMLIIWPEIEEPIAFFAQAFGDDVLVNAAFDAAFERAVEDR